MSQGHPLLHTGSLHPLDALGSYKLTLKRPNSACIPRLKKKLLRPSFLSRNSHRIRKFQRPTLPRADYDPTLPSTFCPTSSKLWLLLGLRGSLSVGQGFVQPIPWHMVGPGLSCKTVRILNSRGGAPLTVFVQAACVSHVPPCSLSTLGFPRPAFWGPKRSP